MCIGVSTFLGLGYQIRFVCLRRALFAIHTHTHNNSSVLSCIVQMVILGKNNELTRSSASIAKRLKHVRLYSTRLVCMVQMVILGYKKL